MKAKQFLADLVLNKTVDIRGFGMGPYNRQIAVVYVESKNVNLELVKAGLAEVYKGKHPRGFDVEPYKKTEMEAKLAKKGIWSLCKEMYISPKDWRKNQK